MPSKKVLILPFTTTVLKLSIIAPRIDIVNRVSIHLITADFLIAILGLVVFEIIVHVKPGIDPIAVAPVDDIPRITGFTCIFIGRIANHCHAVIDIVIPSIFSDGCHRRIRRRF